MQALDWLVLMGVLLVFDEGFPVSGTDIRFLGSPTMETPLSQASTSVSSLALPSILPPLYPGQFINSVGSLRVTLGLLYSWSLYK